MREANPYKRKMVQDPYFIDFIENREEEIRETTYKSYRDKLVLYIQHTGLTPTELIVEAEAEEETIRKLKKRSITRRLNDFSRDLKSGNNFKRSYSDQYRRGVIAVVKGFYNHHEIVTPRLKCKVDSGKRQTSDDLIKKDDIRKMISNANPEYQAIIYLMGSSGISPGDVRKITVGDYLTALQIRTDKPFDVEMMKSELATKSDEIPIWNYSRKKNGIECITFSSPESVKAINLYLEDRTVFHEGYDSILFAPVISTGVVLNKEISESTFSKYFQRINKRCKFPENTGEFGLQCKCHPHNLRKHFATTLKKHGIDSLDVKWMIGHKVNPVTAAYELPDIGALKKNYMKVLPALTINEPVNIKIMENEEEITKLKAQLENTNLLFKTREQEVAELTGRLESVEKMKAKLDNVQKYQGMWRTVIKSSDLSDLKEDDKKILLSVVGLNPDSVK